jgi:hypothetical protein
MKVMCPQCNEVLYQDGLQTLVPEVEDGKVFVIEGQCPVHGYVSGEAAIVEEERWDPRSPSFIVFHF